MEPESEKPTPPVIPPPNLSMQPPPPPSPLSGMPSTMPPPQPSQGTGEGSVKFKIRDGDEEMAAALEFPSFNTRATAAIIDVVVSIGITITLSMVLPGFASKLASLTGIAYMIVRDSLPFLGGQSVGKKAMKIKAVTLDDKPLVGNWEAAVIRNLILVIPPLGLIELFILLTREDKPDRGRRLGDEWAKTKVVIVNEPPAEENPE